MNNPRHWTASEEGKRVKLAADVETQFPDIEQEARKKGITPVTHLQNLAPYAEHEGEPQAAAESVLQQNDIVLLDDVVNGVKIRTDA